MERSILKFLQYQSSIYRASIDAAQVDHYKDEQTAFLALQHYIRSHDYVNLPNFLSDCAQYFQIGYINIQAIDAAKVTHDLAIPYWIEENQALPLHYHNNRILLAISHPYIDEGLEEIRFKTGYTCCLLLADTQQLQKKIDHYLSLTQADKLTASQDTAQVDPLGACENPIVKYVETLFNQAISAQASDIHIESYQYEGRIRFRIDGTLMTSHSLEHEQLKQIISRIKILANLDIAEKRLPQDGKIENWTYADRTIDIRISTTGTIFGEKMVLRLLNANHIPLALSHLGINTIQQQTVTRELQRTSGLILVTGPTGSGKSTSLYAMLHLLNQHQLNITSVEDPVEMYTDGINQISINRKISLDFAHVLRSLLRQDPDVIMIGEIRDLETAQIAIRAAQTGHLVLSTLHTNSASATINRLIDIGIERHNIVAAIRLIIAQRLVRKLCPHCKKPAHYSQEQLLSAGFTSEAAKDITLYKAKQCTKCHKGYHGRIGVFEMLPITHAIAEKILNPRDTRYSSLLQDAKQISLAQNARQIAQNGLTSLEEVNRILI